MKYILITGGAKGLGRFLAENLFEIGYKIIIWDILPSNSLDKTFFNKIEIYENVDLKFSKQIENIISSNPIYKNVGIIINNAAIRNFKYIEDYNLSEINSYFSVNLISPIEITRLFLPIMKKNNFGRIINISSLSAFQSYKNGNFYISTKMGLITFTKSFAKELTNNITINVICPDSFQKRNGEKLKSYNFIINKINKKILNIINNKENGKVIIIARLITKIKIRINNLLLK